MTPTPQHPRPSPSPRTDRAAEIVAVAGSVLEAEGPDAVTMRRIADELGIRAPSLYNHFPGKTAVEDVLVELALFEIGDALHAAVAKPGRAGPVAALLRTYRAFSVAHPNLYRLVTDGSFRRDTLPAGLEDWSGEVFFLAAGEAHLAQALWAYAHGMVSLEIDDRFLAGSDLDRTWTAGARAFTAAQASSKDRRTARSSCEPSPWAYQPKS